MSIRILIADDHGLIRAGLRALLEDVPEMQVVGEAADGHAVLRLTAELQPDIVLMDISMPGMNGIEALRHLIKDRPEVKVIMLSMYSSGPLVQSVLAAGAAGYVLKGSDFAELAATIRRACGLQDC